VRDRFRRSALLRLAPRFIHAAAQEETRRFEIRLAPLRKDERRGRVRHVQEQVQAAIFGQRDGIIRGPRFDRRRPVRLNGGC
jgi:hypothetical protein